MKEHFENITVANLLKWRETAFCSFASSTGKYGHCELGINGLGDWAVRHKFNTHTFDYAHKAIEKYKEIVNPS